jgi:hypothetical protein
MLITVGCGEEARAESGLSGAETAKEFSTKVASAKLKSGAEGQAVISILPGKGFKWNKEYPAKVTFEGAPKHVALAKTQLKQFGGDFKTSDKRADISVKMTGKLAGKETLTAKAKFSVCNDTTCVIREASLNISVAVTK